MTLGNGATVEYQYSDRDELLRIRTVTSSGVVLASYSYEYNDRGERVAVVREHLNERIDYSYDDASRLTDEVSTGNVEGGGTGSPCTNFTESLPGGNESSDSAVVTATPSAGAVPIGIASRSVTWGYDRAGNRSSQSSPAVTYVHDSENRLLSENATAVVYAYDSNGNQISRTEGSIVETYAVDYANRVSAYSKTGSIAFTYLYAPTGQRLSKANLSTAATEWFMNDGSDVITDYSQAGSGPIALATSFVQSLSIDSKVARITASGGGVHFYVPDALGSVTHLLNSSQNIVNSEVTDAWGKVVASSTSVADRYGLANARRTASRG